MRKREIALCSLKQRLQLDTADLWVDYTSMFDAYPVDTQRGYILKWTLPEGVSK
jgi:hypothetical protein